MDDYDTVEYFNTANETLCFGTRCFSDGGSLYETATLCVLRGNEDVVDDTLPEFHSEIYNGKLIFTIGKSIRIFEDLNCTSLIFNAKLEETIDTFCIYLNYVLACLRNGGIVLIDVENLSIVTTSLVVQNVWFKDMYFIHVFAEESSSKDVLNFIVTNKKGIVYRISINLMAEENVESAIETIVNLDMPITYAAKLNNVLALCGNNLIFYNFASDKHEVFIDDNLKFKEIYPYHPKKFIALTEENNVVLICASTGTYFNLFSHDYFQKILFYQDDLDNNICLLVTQPGKDGNCILKAVNMCDNSIIYSLTLKKELVLSLVYPQNFSDSQLYISKFCDQEIRIKIVYEAIPEKRLERLLRAQKFDEAEVFAKQFSLDLVEVKKARANVIANKERCTSNEVDQLMSIISEIEDIDFKFECCFKLTCDNFEDVRKIITYALEQDPKELVYKDIIPRLLYFSEIMHKLDTYSILCKYNEFDFISWNDFSTCNFYDYLCENLSQGQFEMCSILYSRMDRNFIKSLEASDISKILQLLNKYSHEIYFPFLLTFMDKTLLYNSTSIHKFVEWIQDRVLYIEYRDFENFPENAIEFLDKMLKCMKISNAANPDIERNCPTTRTKSYYEELNSIVKCLKIIQILKNNYMILVPLNNCLGGSYELIHVLMNCEISDIDAFIKNFLIGYIIENNLSPDEVFMGEIDNIMEEEDETVWINIVPSLWKYISSMELKLNAMLQILKYARLPWAPYIKEMAYSVLDYKHFLVEQIKMELKREPIYVVWNKEDYKLKHLPIQQVDDYFAFMRIIKSGKESVQEDLYTLSTRFNNKSLANRLLLNSFVRNNELEKALKFISKQDEKDLLAHVNQTISYCKFGGASEQYVQIIDPFLNKACRSDSIKLKQDYRQFAHCLKATCYLNKNYSLKLKTSCIATRKQRDEVLKIILSMLIGNLLDKTDGIIEVIQNCGKVAWALSMEPEQVLVRMCNDFLDLDLLTQCAMNVYEKSSNSKVLCQMTTLILKNVGNLNDDSTNNEFEISMMEDSKISNKLDFQLLNSCLHYAKKMATKALLHASDMEIGDIFNWAVCISNNLEETNRNELCLFPEVYKEFVSLGVVNAMKEIFSIFTNFMSTSKFPPQIDFYINSHQPVVNKVNLKETLNTRFPMIIHNLCSEGKFLHACRFIIALQNCLPEFPDERELLSKYLLKCNKLLIQKILTCRSIDACLAFDLLLFYDYEKATYLINCALSMCKRDVDKFKALAELGIKLSKYHDILNHKQYKKYCDMVLLIKWWKIIKQCVIPYKDFFTMNKDELLKAILSNNYFTVDQIIDFCADFSLNVDPYYYAFLRNILVNWKPVWRIDLDIKQKKYLVMESSDLLEKCLNIISSIPDKESVYNFVNKLLTEVNVYHYEVFICIYKIIAILNTSKNISQKLCLLQFLQSFTRIGKPSTSEQEEWFTQFPNTQKIDPLSEMRLPYTSTLYTKDIWNILRYEANLNNYQNWFKILPFMGEYLNKGDICSYVIKNVVTSGALKSEGKVTWNLHPQHVRLFEEIDACIQHIPALERATSVAYHLLNNTPPGADQVNAARLSYKYAKLYKDAAHKEEDKERVLSAYTKIESKYQGYSTLHILHTNNLAQEKYLKLVNHPKELIDALYLDESITNKETVHHKSDINRVVDEIAEIFDIDIMEHRKTLLEQLFTGDQYFNGNMDDSFSFMNTNVDTNEKDNNYLNKASYICSSSELKTWQQYLVSKGIYDENKTVSHKYQARILKCFLVISDDDSLEQLAQSDRESMTDFINKLFIIHDLQSLGIDMKIDDLEHYKDILKKLSKIANNKLGLRLMAFICKVFNVSDIKPWQFIIYNMIKLKMYDDIHDSLELLADNGIPHIKCYIDGWQAIVDNLFNPSNRDDLEKYYIQKLKTLQSCPVLYRLNLEKAFYKCIELKRCDLAAIMLQYFLDDDMQYKLTDCLLKTNNKENIIEAINCLESFGLQGSSYAVKLLNNY
ncbi:PREDICTED: uncharacterized protein LOC108563530 [Nicrophorus vespilloides]|uniref:Uncharacterized protein LOC108563530 n=1 Tax=Nicrophorus vespilloides TaxID=110193 RepID=A0ABM1MT20_NICVS|nr:PREDICTED: uncharacterized protein LOC108563530 [Nicrophorus vespilloides]